jgi:hypothetical protein
VITPKPKICKEAGEDVRHQKRPASFPGPRCFTCWAAKEKLRKENAHRTRVARVYGVPKDFYDLLYKFQGGKCALCQKATGATKRLANDHDHDCCPGPEICGLCLRGLLCGVCNEIIGRWDNNPDTFLRGFRYLIDPPARQLRRLLDERNGAMGVEGNLGRNEITTM